MTGRGDDTEASLRFIIQCWRSGIRTMGDTPRAAMAGTASCMAASGGCLSDANRHTSGSAWVSLPSIFPCSQSTMTHSAPALARILETLDPGIICQTPMDGPLLASKACFSLLDWIIVEWLAMALDDDRKRFGGELEKDGRIERRQRDDDDTSFLRHR